MKTIIISPTYNEKENIETLIDEVFKRNPDYHMLIVDDNSEAFFDDPSVSNSKIFESISLIGFSNSK